MTDNESSLSRRGLLAAAPAVLLGSGEGRYQSDSVRTPARGVVAEPGRVQRTIDRVANGDGFAHGSYTRLTLRTGTTYTPRRTWKVKRGVILDFNGAKVVPASDRDAVHLHPEAHLVRPFVDVRDRDYPATAVTLDTRYGKYGGPNRATIEQAHLLSDPGNGTGIALHDRNGRGIWDTQFSGMIQGFETAISLRASGGRDAYVNSNHFDATVSAYTTAVEHRGATGAAVNGNHLDLIAQPATTSRHLWDLRGDAAFNTMEADVWDKRLYRDQSQIVRFNGGNNTLIDRFGFTNADHARGGGHVTGPHGTGIVSESRDNGENGGESGNDEDSRNGGRGDSSNPSENDGDSNPSENDGGKTLVVKGTGSYTVVVEGSVRISSDVEDGKLFGGDAIKRDGPQADTMSIKGNVIGGKDVYEIRGRVLRQAIRGDVRVTVDGASV